MSYRFFHIKTLVKRISIVLVCYTLCRLLFFLFNYVDFRESSSEEIFIAFVHGIRFDISAVLYINLIFIFFSLAEQFISFGKIAQTFLKYFFITTNSAGLILNLMDIEYFRFQKKRTTFELFSGENDVWNLLPEYFKSYWHIVLILILFVFIMIIMYKKTERNNPERKGFYSIKAIVSVLIFGFIIIGLRGGLQTKPAQMITASYYGNARNASLVLNTPFTIFQSIGKKTIENPKFYSTKEAEAIFNIERNYTSKYQFTPKNIVVIILESFSNEWIGALSGKQTCSPFLDSLINNSLVFENAFSNGKKSNEALPSILASIPSLMEESFSSSVYQDNEFYSLPGLLKSKGYYTAFYHGGLNGSMNFDAFSRKAGVDKYFGMNEYPVKEDYDGNWGIYDEPYFQYFYHELNEAKKPFFAGVFSLSSHHPYSLPEKYKDSFNELKTPIEKAFRYTDLSLKHFFERASSQKWFFNTIFVITADHSSKSEDPTYNAYPGYYRVPLIFYEPGTNSLKGKRKDLAQQIDIMPSILDYLGYEDKFNAFGESLMRPKKYEYAIQYENGRYDLIDSLYTLSFSEHNALALYDYKLDPILKQNIISARPDVTSELEKKIKAYIQVFNTRVSENKLK